MLRKFSAEAVLHIMIAAYLAGIAGVAALGYLAVQDADARAVSGARKTADLQAAAALARSADRAARNQTVELGEIVSRASSAATSAAGAIRARTELVQKPLDEALQLLTRQQVDATPLSRAAAVEQRIQREYEDRMQQMAGGASATAPSAASWEDVGPALETLANQEVARLESDSTTARSQLAWALILATAFGVALTFFFRWWIRRANVGPLRTAYHMVQRVAGGDLTARADGLDQLHTRKIGQALNEMSANLRKLVSEVTHGARTVADTSAQIAQGNLDLSQRTEEQATTLEETASSMEQLTSTVAQNADNARQASQLAVEASEVARRGGVAVGQVVSTMNGISEASRKIGDIIGVIDAIAFQTNILALNAAVEAARAGEQGRGFAVVAAEVRSLAQRSAAAAKEIKTLIGDSVDRVEAGGKQVDSAGRTMQEIVASVKKVSDLIAEIAAASQEQSSGIGQVNTAIAQMEQVVQQNASLVEEASAATESMKEQANILLQAISRFHIGDGSQAQRMEAAPTPIAPIKVRPRVAALPPGVTTQRQPAARASAPVAGEWEEF